MEEQPKKRGGARPGAGRKKKEGRDSPVTFRISTLAKERLIAFAEARGISQQEAAIMIFEGLE